MPFTPTISITKYVDITSGVVGEAQAVERELIGRLFTTNELVPTKSLIEATSADAVGTVFGFTSEEYKRALFYFSYISKQVTSPKKIGFYRWADVDTIPQVIGAKIPQTLTDYNTLNDASFNLTIGAVSAEITTDLTTAASLADVASLIETQVQAADASAVFAGSTFTYDAIAGLFRFDGGDSGNFTISVNDPVAGTNILTFLGFAELTTIVSDGVTEESISQVLSESESTSNNFLTYKFIPALDDAQHTEASQFADSTNIRYMYCYGLDESEAQAQFDNNGALGGVAFTIIDSSLPNQYDEMIPMRIAAAIDYSRVDSNTNFMFTNHGLTPKVNSDQQKDTLDPIKANYIGVTQQAGNKLEFYQTGVLYGGPTVPNDMNVYVNEVWLKDAITVNLINLLLAVNAVSASQSGVGLVLASLVGDQVKQPGQAVSPTDLSPIQRALNNGVIVVGKSLDSTQISTITTLTNNPRAYLRIINDGYLINVTIQDGQNNTKKIVYVLIYATNEAVRLIEGSNQLL